jgi:hypothetical protein
MFPSGRGHVVAIKQEARYGKVSFQFNVLIQPWQFMCK